MVNKFTQKAQKALSLAYNFSSDMGHSYIGSEHLLLGLISQKESIASRILVLRGADERKLKQSIIDYMGIGTRKNPSPSDMTPRLRKIIEEAAEESKRSGVTFVGTEHLLMALMNTSDAIAVRLLEAEGIPSSEIRADLAAYVGTSPQRSRERALKDEETRKAKKQSLLLYGKDLTALAAKNLTDPVLCREKETERLIRILCRRTKNNPCIVGEPGVGKTAIVEGLAERIALGDVPDELKSKKIITLDISSMLAGAKYRGEFEDRIKNVIEEVKKDTDIILFVDEMHIMVGAGAAEGAIDASNILKPALSRGEIKMIGATTPDEYRSYIEKDPAFERRFQPIILQEPSSAEAKSILEGLRCHYEKHHGIIISNSAIEAAVDLSVRYIHERFLPDKALDLLDEAAAKIKLSSKSSSLAKSHISFREEKEAALKSGDFDKVSDIIREESLQSSHTAVISRPCEETLPILDADDIASVVSEQTGIPVKNLLEADMMKLVELESVLNSKIIGQEAAVSKIAAAIRKGRIGLGNPLRPIGSFLFLGSTGVGKTELCRVLAQTMFEGKNSLIKLDMSEYMEKQSISKLIGSPPGYVGYKEGGMLTEKVRRHPYCVVLFDEIEKAHPDIFNILLQILEDGRLADSSGKSVDFSNTVIILTSNLLSAEDASRNSLGFSDIKEKNDNISLRTHKKLTENFHGELLGRIDEIILFSPLDEEKLEKITELTLQELRERAFKIGINLSIEKGVAKIIAKKSSAQKTGARAIRQEITDSVETPLCEYILSGKIKKSAALLCEDGNLLWQF